MIRYEVIFKGRVQGVGFRYSAKEMAEEFGIVGWVRNRGDGSVEMLAEGDEALLDELVKRLEDRFGVRDKTLTRLKAFGGLAGFDISY